LTEETKHKKRKFLFNPLKRPLPYIGLIIAFVLIIFQQTIRNYVSDTIGDMLINSMKEATGGVYKTTYDLVRFDIISSELRISNLQIELDTSVISRKDYLASSPNLLHINTPVVVVKLRSLLPLVLNNQLYVSYVGAKNPEFILTKSLHSSQTKETSNSRREGLRGAVNTYFAALEIDSFRVEKGSFRISNHSEDNIDTDVIDIGEFTTMLKNFRLDSLSPSILLKGIRAQSLDLEIIDQEVNLPEINQSVYFKRLSLSTTDSTFIVDSLRIKNIVSGSSKNVSDLAITKLEILGFNFDNAFSQNELFINEIRLNKPNLIFRKKNFDKKSNRNSQANSSFFQYFNQLDISKINILNGSIDYQAEYKSKISDFTISISDYKIEPTDWAKKKPVSSFKVLLFNATEMEQELPDSIHIAKVGQIIYTEHNNKAFVHKLKLNPISGRNTYKSLRSKNSNLSTYSSVNSVTLTHFYPEKLVLSNQLDIDSIILDRPYSSIMQYPAMRIAKNKSANKNSNLKLSINHFITNNGSIKLRRYQNGINQQTLLNGIYFRSSSMTKSLTNKTLPTDYKLLISNGSIELKNIGHTAYFNTLSLDESLKILIDKAEIKPDSSTLPYHHIKGTLKNLLVQGLDIETLNRDKILIDSISIGSLDMLNNFTREAFIKTNMPRGKSPNSIEINDFGITKSNINIKEKGSIVSLHNASLNLQNIKIDSLQESTEPIINFNNTVLNMDGFRFEKLIDNTLINGKSSRYSEVDSTLMVSNLTFSSEQKNLDLDLESFRITGLDKFKLKVKKQLEFRKLELVKPSFNYVAKDNQRDSLNTSIDVTKIILKEGLRKIRFDSLQIIEGRSNVSLANDKTLNINSIKGIITDVDIDTLTTIFDVSNQFKGVFELKDIYLRGLNDTLSVAKLHLNTEHRFIWTDSIHFNTHLPSHTLRATSPGIAIDHINIPKLLENKIAVGRISTRNNFILLTQTDTIKTENTSGSAKLKLPFDIMIDDINLLNTTFKYHKIDEPKHLLANLNFDIELDSLLVKKGQLLDLAKHTTDARFRNYHFTFDLPDSLNSVRFDTLLVSSGNSQINISNLALKARYPKYEYGNQVGHQVDWKDLLIEKIKVENIDFVELVENQSFKCNKIIITEGYLDLFKDKQLPFPTDRVIPILQERIKGIKVPVKIDTIEIKSVDIFQTTLQSTGLQEGGISFINTNGLITNITNDSTRLQNNRKLKVVAESKIMGSGSLNVKFDFDMLDENNLFAFDAQLDAMDAQEFNSILEATALVSVKSGAIKSIKLEAIGNKSYTYGNMSFIYNNLKVETVNKETLDKKGMGNAIKTFFANAFVVKKNNSRIKLLGRRGEMYYERDKSRITLDYMAKTAISGVVSSIGAKNNRKEIKQINKNNKDARDLELKQQKELEKAVKKQSR